MHLHMNINREMSLSAMFGFAPFFAEARPAD
jgi:hypothetical protein